jgi:hypothetical protein
VSKSSSLQPTAMQVVMKATFQGASSSLERTRTVPRMEERGMMVYG